MDPQRISTGDPALSAVATVNEVDMSSDLTVAKVYISILSDEEGKATAMSGLKRLQGYVRTQVASNMNLRFAPEVRFMYDENADYQRKV